MTGEFSAQRPVTLSFNVFFYLRLNKPHYDVTVMESCVKNVTYMCLQPMVAFNICFVFKDFNLERQRTTASRI